MKRTFLILTVAAQLAASGAVAQTSTTGSGTSGSGATSSTFGSDWSTSLGTAMFGEGGATVRSESELASQWDTLSEEDKEMIRRDCMAYTQSSGDTAASTGSASGTTGAETDSTGAATSGSGAAADSTGSAAGSAGTMTDSAGATSGSDASGTTSGAADAGSGSPMDVTMEQMEQICAATKDL